MGSKKNVSRAFLTALGAAVRESRRGQGLRQDDLGARIGVPGSRIGEVERGITNTSAARIAEIAAGLGISTVALLKRAEALNVKDGENDEIRARAVENLRHLDVADLELVAQIVARLSRVKG